MESLLILIPIAIMIVAVAVCVFFWAVKNGQFEDLDTEGKRILFDKRRSADDMRECDRSTRQDDSVSITRSSAIKDQTAQPNSKQTIK